MKPEEKYFVVEGIQEDFQYYNREHGFWLYRRGANYTTKELFFKDRSEAINECEKRKKLYAEAITYFREGDVVWFMKDNLICTGIIEDLINIGYNMRYCVKGFDGYFSKDEIFKTKEKLMEHLLNNIVKTEEI